MTADQLFRVCNLAAMVGWLILVFAGRVRWAARLVGISHLVVIPCLLLTFVFGPAGLLGYLVLRMLRVREGIEF